MHVEPGLCLFGGREHLHNVAALFVNPDGLGSAIVGYLKLSWTLCIAGCCRFLTLTQLGDRPAR
jgi:hypothetical protein